MHAMWATPHQGSHMLLEHLDPFPDAGNSVFTIQQLAQVPAAAPGVRVSVLGSVQVTLGEGAVGPQTPLARPDNACKPKHLQQSRPYKDAPDRLLWRDKTRPARTYLVNFSLKAYHELARVRGLYYNLNLQYGHCLLIARYLKARHLNSCLPLPQ